MPDRRSRSSSRSSSSSSSSKRSRSRDRERNQRWRPKRRSKSREKDFKSRICIHWQRGHCSKGEDCRFAHGAHELSSVQGGTWKTVLCKHFEQGTCRRGANCSFAHGEKELRDTYKTILCKYYELGTCKSGDKCNFAHGKEELVKLELPKIEKVEPRIEVKAEKFMEPLNQPEPEKDEAEKAQKAERAEKRTPKKQVPCRYWQNGYCNRAESCPFSHEGPQNERPKEAVPVFKTVLCKYFEQGHCTRGDSCTYAHGIEELQTREAGTYKTVLCKFFEAGTCTKGASCTFAHGGTDLLMDQPATVPPGAPCATAATAWTGTSLADAIAQSAVDSQEPAGPVGVLIQPTRQLSKRQLETIQPVERKQVEMRLIHHEVRPQVEVITVKRCAFFAVGRCKKGEECSYSHQDGPPTVTLVKPRAQPVHVPPRIHVPPAWPEEAEHAEQVDLGSAPNGFPWKTRLCKFFQMGHCNKGASCSYAHGPDEFSGDFVQAANEDVEMELEDVPLPAHFKTQLCKFFTETGQCRKDNACDYAHGTEELRPPQDRPPPVVVPPLAPEERAALAEKEAAEAWKETRGAETVDVDEWDTGWKDSYWKTRPCRFFELGTCNKGAACAFAHGLPISISSGGTIFANAPIKVKDEVHFE